jgi:hypothetical protein
MRTRHGGPSAIEIVAMPNWPMVQALVIGKMKLGRGLRGMMLAEASHCLVVAANLHKPTTFHAFDE